MRSSCAWKRRDAHTVIEGLNSEQLSYTEGAVDWKKPGIYVCSLPFAEGFQCLLEHIIVYTRRELFPKEKKLVLLSCEVQGSQRAQ